MNTQPETQHFSKEGMTVKLNPKANCCYHVEVTLEPTSIQKQHKDAIKTISKQVSLPGFRRGKAPEQVILNHYSSAVEEEWKEQVSQYGVNESVVLAQLKLISSKSIEKYQLKTCSLQNGATLEYECEAWPQIPTIDDSEIELQAVPLSKITQEQVEKEVLELRLMQAISLPIVDRPAQEGDYIYLDIENLEEEGQYICQEERFQIGPDTLSLWIRQRVVGANVDDSFEATSELDPQASDEVKQVFLPTRCRVTVKKICQIELPAIDETFLKTYKAESLEQLQERLKEYMHKQNQQQHKSDLKEKLYAYLADKYSFDLPQTFVQQQKQQFLQEELRMLKQQKVPADQMQDKRKELEEKTHKQACEYVLTTLLLQQLAQDKNISIEESDVYANFNKEMMQLKYLRGKEFDKLTNDHFAKIYNNTKQEMILQKATDYLLEKANLV